MQPTIVKVLIVEDDFLVREVVQELLEKMNYEVSGKATTGQQAVTMAESLRPDVILMDIEMPDMDGIEATEIIFERCPTPVVVLTAYETPELVERAGAAGVGAYLLKPPRERELERAISIAMARFADMVELRRINVELQARNEALEEALAQVKTLSGLLPICSSCKKIRNDDGYWQQIEIYIRDHSQAEFSHSLCPDCAKKLYPEMYLKSDEQAKTVLETLKLLGWSNLDEIAAHTGLPAATILNRVHILVNSGQVKCLNVDGENFYKLP